MNILKKLALSDIEIIVRTMAETAIENEQYFSELDAVVGDADFGVSLATGFRAVLEQWDGLDRSSIGTFLMKVGSIIIGNVGGCSGPIWGTAFMRSGIKSKDMQSIDLNNLVEMLRSAIDGIQARGGAELGDKTLLDAIAPATERFDEFSQLEEQDVLGAFNAATEAATEAIESTKNWEARRGRQSFTGERSIGTLDPGIVAVATMLQQITVRLNEVHLEASQ